jgi:hypothetical protein
MQCFIQGVFHRYMLHLRTCINRSLDALFKTQLWYIYHSSKNNIFMFSDRRCEVLNYARFTTLKEFMDCFVTIMSDLILRPLKYAGAG